MARQSTTHEPARAVGNGRGMEVRQGAIRVLGFIADLAARPRMGERKDEPNGIEDAWAALSILAGYTPARLAEARREHFAVWEAGFERDGMEPPEWINELRRRVEQAT